jgi:hypothetical protein
MPSLDYIVRIYRFERDRPQSIVGVVEEVGIEGKRAFTNLDELWGILSCSGDSDVSKGAQTQRKQGQRRSGL